MLKILLLVGRGVIAAKSDGLSGIIHIESTFYASKITEAFFRSLLATLHA